MNSKTSLHFGYVAAILVVSIAISGYFIGLQSPMNRLATAAETSRDVEPAGDHGAVLPAQHYTEMNVIKSGVNKNWKTDLSMLEHIETDPNKPIVITPQQKAFALAIREQNRSFNGAPPTIPHTIDQMSTTACVACHQNGASSESLRIPKMSHPFLANCTQCHVENSPQHLAPIEFRENSFVGLPAPNGGPRAFPGAPPQIPHSVWMRNDCLSCHGPNGNFGIRTTHPWRQSCQQCHAPSSQLNQNLMDPVPQFLAPPKVSSEKSSNE